jgi:hypothetical protein
MKQKNNKTPKVTKIKVSHVSGGNSGDIEAFLLTILQPDMDKPLPIDVWRDELLGCPSQCYFHTQKGGSDYVLYLRWRWEDPWQGHIFKAAKSQMDVFDVETERSPDLFEENKLFFDADQLDEAKAAIIEFFHHSSARKSSDQS